MPSFPCFNCQHDTTFMGGRGLCEDCVRAVSEARQHADPDFASQDFAAQQALAARHVKSSQQITDPLRV